MNLQIASCADQYKKSPQLNRNDVLELLEWQKTQPHLPNVSGKYHLHLNYYQFFRIVINTL